MWPIAMNTPSTGRSLRSPVCVLSRAAAVTAPFPTSLISSISVFHSKEIFGLANALSCMIFDARSDSRRWMTVTCDAKRVRKIASSIAVSPPPTTAIGLPRKK